MHVNNVVLLGRAGERGVTLTDDERSTPTCSFTLEVDEVSPTGKVFTSYIPVEIVGKYAEAASERIEAGQEIHVDGKLRLKKFPTRKAARSRAS